MDSTYRAIQAFLEREIEALSGPLDFDQRLINELCRYAQPSVVKKALKKINYRRKVYSERIFTEQTQRHCIMEIHDNVKARVERAREDLAAQEQQLVAPEVVDASKRQYKVGTLTDEELERLAENIIQSSDGSQRNSSIASSLTAFKESKASLKKYEHAFTMITDQLDKDMIRENHISLNPELSDDILEIRRIAQDLRDEITKNPGRFKEFLRRERLDHDTRDQQFVLTSQLPEIT